MSDKSRSLLMPCLVTAAAFAVLIALGVWQLQRKTWKEDLIATMTARLADAPERDGRQPDHGEQRRREPHRHGRPHRRLFDRARVEHRDD